MMPDPMTPSVLILRTAGTNCDRELAHAFAIAGGRPTTLHLHRLIEQPDRVGGFDIIAIPGGFSYGDDIAAGRIFAHRLRRRLLDPLRDAVARGVPVIGICNGFQVLVKLGLLPDPAAARQRLTLADNVSGRFVDRWVRLDAAADSPCIWTRGLGRFELPVAHAEGRLAGEPGVIDELAGRGQLPLRYTAEDDPNGSTGHVAGVCDPSGVVLGLMPHPERYVEPTQHPAWTRRAADEVAPGLRFFENAIAHVRERAGSAARA